MDWDAAIFEVVDRSAPQQRQQERLLPKKISNKSRRGNLVNHFHNALHTINYDSSDHAPIELSRVNWGTIPFLLSDRAATPQVLDMLYGNVESARRAVAGSGFRIMGDKRNFDDMTKSPFKRMNSVKRFDAVQKLITEAKKARMEADKLEGKKVRVKEQDAGIKQFPELPVKMPQEVPVSAPQIAA